MPPNWRSAGSEYHWANMLLLWEHEIWQVLHFPIVLAEGLSPCLLCRCKGHLYWCEPSRELLNSFTLCCVVLIFSGTRFLMLGPPSGWLRTTHVECCSPKKLGAASPYLWVLPPAPCIPATWRHTFNRKQFWSNSLCLRCVCVYKSTFWFC